MLTYNNLVAGLESAWTEAGLHEHDLIESIQPDSHDRSYKAELFPDHPDPLNEDNMPPWVEIGFNWSAYHQLRSEGHPLSETTTAFDLTWVYNVMVRKSMRDYSDQELVRMFQRGVQAALRTFYPEEITEGAPVAVEVRRIYHSIGQRIDLSYIHLVSPNISDLSDHWNERDPLALRSFLQFEFDLASEVIQSLAKTFYPGPSGRGAYRSVDTA